MEKLTACWGQSIRSQRLARDEFLSHPIFTLHPHAQQIVIIFDSVVGVGAESKLLLDV